MIKSLLLTAVLSALVLPTMSYAEEVPAPEAAPASDWSFSSNEAYISDYYVRGISQNFHKPALQDGFDVEHSSGFSAGVWASNVSPNTFPDASLEIDIYAGFGGDIGESGVGYSVGLIGYTYPGGSWGDCIGCTKNDGVTLASNNAWDTNEATYGLTYSYFGAMDSTTLGNWFGLDENTG